MVFFALTTWLERKLLGRMQNRYGPNRAGPKGLLRPDRRPAEADPQGGVRPDGGQGAALHHRAGRLDVHGAARVQRDAVRRGLDARGYRINGAVVDVPISLILIFALGSLGIYGFIVGGWASESKYSILGSMRTCAQLVSYEVSLALSVLGVVLMGQSLNLQAIVDKQQATVWFFIPQFVGLCVFLLGGVAETSRPPFDLPEADTELVAGYHTEYSGMRWGIFQAAEYVNMLVLSGLCVTLFFGGYHFPWVPSLDKFGPIWFVLKLFTLVDPLHLAARLSAASPLRPADAVRLEGAAPGRDRQRARHRLPRGGRLMSFVVPNTLKGFGVTLKQVFKKPITQQYPEYKRPVYPRYRGRHRLHRARERPREVRRLLAVRGRLSRRLHPRRSGGEHRRQPRLGRRALRADLRDQHVALHLLRLLRARLPVRRDHARKRLRDLRVQPRRPDLHEGHAARTADQARAGRRRRPLRHADPLLRGQS